MKNECASFPLTVSPSNHNCPGRTFTIKLRCRPGGQKNTPVWFSLYESAVSFHLIPLTARLGLMLVAYFDKFLRYPILHLLTFSAFAIENQGVRASRPRRGPDGRAPRPEFSVLRREASQRAYTKLQESDAA